MPRVLVFSALCLLMPAASVFGQELGIPARLSLEEALRFANDRNPTLAAARNAIEIAQSGRIEAGLRPNPAVTFESGSYPLFEPSRPPFLNNQELTLRFDQEIELAGRRRLRTQTADAGVSAAEAGFQDQRRRLEFDVRRAYFTVVLAKADLEVSRAALDEIDRVIGLNRARYEQGEISGGELRRVQVERLKFVDDLFAAQLALRNARSALLALFNSPDLSVEFDVVETLNVANTPVGQPTTAIDPTALRTQALAARPDRRSTEDSPPRPAGPGSVRLRASPKPIRSVIWPRFSARPLANSVPAAA